MKTIGSLLKLINEQGLNTIFILFRSMPYLIFGKMLLVGRNVKIKGVKNINVENGYLLIGIDSVGFVSKDDFTFLNIKGTVNIIGNVRINRGCRLDVRGKLTIGDGTYINPFTKIIVSKGLIIGKSCAISWNCEFLDDSFHSFLGKKRVQKISIGDNVWLGSHVSVNAGVEIKNGCVVTSHSVINHRLICKNNSLIAGNPAKMIKENIEWT